MDHETSLRMKKERQEKIDGEMKRRVIVLIVLGVLLIAAVATLITYRAVVTNYEFQREVHSYMENAYWASTPGVNDNSVGVVHGWHARAGAHR